MYFQRVYVFCNTLRTNNCHLRNRLSNNEDPFKIKTLISNTKFTFYSSNITPCLNLNYLLRNRSFHSSNRKNALPPTIWSVLRTLLQSAAIVTGRNLRIWWKNLPKDKRTYIMNQIKKHQQNIIVGSVFSTAIVYTFYTTHVVEDPITKRKKFLIFSEDQVIDMANNEWKIIMKNYKGNIIKSGYHYDKVMRISHQILNANSHLPKINRNWQVFIVDDNKTKNAFVLPSGHIFIFTGMLAVVSNEDQLAAVIAHEISHVLLSHSAEQVSKTYLLEIIMVLPFLAICALFPGSEEITYRITEYLCYVLFHLPFSRSLESEADILGLEMMSRACYDPKQASLFWRKMEQIEKDKQIEWLSTHPSHKKRYKMLDDQMFRALKIFADTCMVKDMHPHLST